MRWGWSFALLCAFCAPSLRPAFALEDAHATCDTAAVVLAQWERASSGLLGVGPLEDRRLHHLHGAEHSAHEIAILNEFRGPVSASDLARRFEWSVKTSAEEPILIGKPTDELERLFYERLAVTIDPKTHLPKSVSFFGTHSTQAGEPLAVVMSPRIEEPNRFPHDPHARPLKVARRNEDSPRRSPIRVVEHITRTVALKPRLPADVEHALTAWETAAGQVRSLHANVKRYTYETKTHIEHRAVGELTFAAPQIVQCTLKPAPIDPNATSHRRTTDGVAFELLPSPAEFWQYTPDEIRFSHRSNQPLWVLSQAEDERNQVQWVSREDHQTGQEPIIPPWPMLFHPRALELAERFDIRVSDQRHVTTWEFAPRQQGDVDGFQLMRVLLDKATFLPRAVQVINRAGDVEMVYTFEYTQFQGKAAKGIEPKLLPIKPHEPNREPAQTTLHGLP